MCSLPYFRLCLSESGLESPLGLRMLAIVDACKRGRNEEEAAGVRPVGVVRRWT